MYEFKGAKLPRVFRSLPISVATTMGIKKPELPTKAAVELDEQARMGESRFHPEPLLVSLMKIKGVVFAAGSFQFRDSSSINITVSCARSLISKTLLQPNKRHRLLMSSAYLPLLAATKKKERVMEMTDAAASTAFSEEGTLAMEVFSEGMNSARYIYDSDSRDRRDLQKAGTGREVAESVAFILCDTP